MKDFILPDIGEGIVECELLKWHVAEGDVLVEDQAVADVMTDKATVEIPAMHAGKVAKLYYKEGEIAKVHAPLFAMAEESDDINESVAEPVNNHASDNDDESHAVESFVLPDIGEGIVECEIVQWHVQAGDNVIEDQVVVEVMTDKAIVEIPAKHDGIIACLHYQKGEIAKVHTPLFDQHIKQDGGGQQAEPVHNANTELSDSSRENSVAANTPSQQQNYKQGEQFEAPIDVGRALASPAVRRLAKELSVSLSTVSASGKKGRVLKQDVIDASSQGSETSNTVNQSSTQPKSDDTLSNVSVNNTANTNQTVQDRVEAVKGVRAAMAKQMMASVSSIPHFSVSDELCMDKLITLRSSLKPSFEKDGIKLSFLPFFIKALSLAMQQFPIINSRLNEQATELTYLGAHNIGIAVDGKLGLMVPNIKNVQHLSLHEVAAELTRLIDAARDGKLTNKDLSAGSISISNIGAIGGITATPVINKPNVAIVALGKTQSLPRFNAKGKVKATSIMTINWSGDHRVIDGATMVKFNNLWMDYLTHPEKMMVHLR